MPSDALKQFSALGYDKTRLELCPHGGRLLHELIAAAKSELWVSVIILSATLVDVAVNEAGQFSVSFDDDEDGDGDGAAEVNSLYGLSYLSAGERRRLDALRARRNALVHYEGPVSGVSGAGDDTATLAADADQAMIAVLPVLENLERWG